MGRERHRDVGRLGFGGSIIFQDYLAFPTITSQARPGCGFGYGSYIAVHPVALAISISHFSFDRRPRRLHRAAKQQEIQPHRALQTHCQYPGTPAISRVVASEGLYWSRLYQKEIYDGSSTRDAKAPLCGISARREGNLDRRNYVKFLSIPALLTICRARVRRARRTWTQMITLFSPRPLTVIRLLQRHTLFYKRPRTAVETGQIIYRATNRSPPL